MEMIREKGYKYDSVKVSPVHISVKEFDHILKEVQKKKEVNTQIL